MAVRKRKSGTSTGLLFLLGIGMLILGLGVGCMLSNMSCGNSRQKSARKVCKERRASGGKPAGGQKSKFPRGQGAQEHHKGSESKDSKEPAEHNAHQAAPVARPEKPSESPSVSVPEKTSAPVRPPLPGAVQAQKHALPRFAVVMDDFGYIPLDRVRRICAQPIPFTVAVLPFMEHTRSSAEIAHASGKEVLLHLPMEPHGAMGPGRNPGPGAIMAFMDEAETRAKVRKALLDVPWRKGVNNHMGSRITPDAIRMGWILQEVKASGCYFLDSRTEKTSLALQVASRLGVKVASRQVFLDDDKSYPAMKKQWDRALEIAKREGEVLLICHIYPETIDALEKLYPATRDEVRFVKASELAR